MGSLEVYMQCLVLLTILKEGEGVLVGKFGSFWVKKLFSFLEGVSVWLLVEAVLDSALEDLSLE